MDNAEFTAPLKETLETLKVYIDQQVRYNKLLLTKKTGEMSAWVTLFMLLGFLGTLVLIFFSFAFVWWYSGSLGGERYVGFLIVTGFYFLLAVLIFLLRKPLIFDPIRKLLGDILYENGEEEKEASVFSSKELLDSKLKESREEMEKQEELLKEQLAELNETLTFTNVTRVFFKNAYQSVVTTTNVARASFLLVSKLKDSFKRKSKKGRARLKSPEE